MYIRGKNPAKDFLIRNSFFIFLYFATACFIFKMPNISNYNLLYFSSRLLLMIPFIIIGIGCLYTRSLVHMDKDSIDIVKARKDFVRSGICFNAAILIFFTVIFLWIISLGGVPNCAFSGLLTTAPVFFIFGSPNHYRDILDDGSSLVNRDLYKLSLWENIFRWFTYIVYFISVISFDFSIIEKLIRLKMFENPLLKFVITDTNNIKSCNQYQVMSIVIFLGSVAAVIVPYIIAKHSRESSNKANSADAKKPRCATKCKITGI